jgi:hypothetical protein
MAAPQPALDAPTWTADDNRRSRLGEILVNGGAITQTQLKHALAQQASLKLPLGEVLLKLNYVTDEVMRQASSTSSNA